MALQTIKMGAKAAFLITLVALACAANAAEEMTTMQQLQNEGIGLSAAYTLILMQRPNARPPPAKINTMRELHVGLQACVEKGICR